MSELDVVHLLKVMVFGCEEMFDYLMMMERVEHWRHNGHDEGPS
jgi:hypothetical protein